MLWPNERMTRKEKTMRPLLKTGFALGSGLLLFVGCSNDAKPHRVNDSTAVISCEAARITMETVETKPENGTMNGPVEETDGNN